MSAGLRTTASELASLILETSRSFFWKHPEISFGNTKRMDTKTHLGFWGELMGRTRKTFELSNSPKTQ